MSTQMNEVIPKKVIFHSVQNMVNTSCNVIYHLAIWLSRNKISIFHSLRLSRDKIFSMAKCKLSCKRQNFIHLYLYLQKKIIQVYVAQSVTSVMSNSVQPYGLQPAKLLCPWDSPGKNTGVGCPALLHGIFLTQGWNTCLLYLPALASKLFTISTTWEAQNIFI